jgi:hypothetical protein
VRELENALERAIILSTGGDLDVDAIVPAQLKRLATDGQGR